MWETRARATERGQRLREFTCPRNPPKNCTRIQSDECGDVSHNITDHETTTTATARAAQLNDTHQQASSTELDDFYTTYYHLSLL
jgi:hypothetical protein